MGGKVGKEAILRVTILAGNAGYISDEGELK